MFEILNIFHKAEFQYHHIYDCDLNNCKKKAKINKHSNFENLGFGEFFFLVLTRDRNNFETKMSFIQTSELKIHQVQNIRWQLWFEKLKKSKELRYAESFLKCLNFQYEKFIFKLHLRREITTKLKILENMIRLSFWKCFFLELVSLSMAFWRL